MPPTSLSKALKFASTKNERLKTAKNIYQGREDKIRQAEDAAHLGRPPPGKYLVQASLVLPGQHLLPVALDEPAALDDIRKNHRVYITRDVPNVLEIHCDSIHRLQQAFKAVNWRIRDMRLSNDSSPARFLVQRPTKAAVTDMIQLKLGTRPSFLSKTSNPISNASSMDEHLPRLASDLASSAEGLMALNKTMGLRVSFGHVIIAKRPKGTEDEITFDHFTTLMNMYPSRGGASMVTRLGDAHEAEKLLQYISRPEAGICKSMKDMRRGCEVVVVANGLQIKTEADYNPQLMQLAMVRATRPETRARWSWTTAAPDMEHDWNIRMDAWDKVDVPTEFRDLAKRISVVFKPDEGTILPLPNVNTSKLAIPDERFTEIQARSWAIIPFKESPYVLKINITKTLKGSRTIGEQNSTWGVELYAPHWEESLNYSSRGRKDWGEGLENIWEEGDDLQSRLGCFLRTIMEVQALLNRVQADTASS
ncbi:hypothetical protein H9Q69_013799 [Fusarium xylarioides]|uniref:Uncharacterized protein n=1 Tax=Fusarium xylarioides TaxID=221167 RepID=A0A9P7I522_9HYPO|nr:hypothetical protein H9Q70_012611 [Fusarium xylarioides]KAG5756021.1 hypothetical protein H9Q72_014452 [Fusarium xylarioides]KAG5777481.1 hypothetical protein H9Q73_008842 [Fusarium xylarioides]KAG5787133.1 hypothetical protein H9Q69_013799 [Fusarium xylarioides]KAG5801035.1 hypothetical protein H9Q71_014383 [Fusarium xylarioides]